MFTSVIIVEYEGTVGETLLIHGTDKARFDRQCQRALIDAVCRHFGTSSGYKAEEIEEKVMAGETSITSADGEYTVSIRDLDEVIDSDQTTP